MKRLHRRLNAHLHAAHLENQPMRCSNTAKNRLLVEIEIVTVMAVTVVVVMVMRVYFHYDLRLRRERCREAGCENESKPKLFHAL